jgi:4-amino-4-deoxy-L-arabinose transferase-like glycosyltransferase
MIVSNFRASLTIWLVALLARVAFVIAQTKFNMLSMSFYANDSRMYDALAQSILNGQGMALNGMPTAFRPPAYPIFLAACYWLFGRNFLLIGLLQSALGALSCVFVFKIARSIFDSRVAWLAGMLCALMPSLIIWTSGVILTEPLYIFLLTVSLYCLIRMLPQRAQSQTEEPAPVQLGYAAIAGIALGLATLTRPLALYFAACAIIYLWYKTGWVKGTVVAAVLIVIISCWGFRNYQSMGRLIVTTTSGGETLYVYHNIYATGDGGGYDPYWKPLEEAERLPELERDAYYKNAALSFALNNVGREIVLSVGRFWNMWRPAYAASSTRNLLVSWLTYIPIICFSIPVILRTYWRTPRTALLCLFLLFHLFFHLLVGAELRFRFPLEPVLIIYASAGLLYAYTRFRNPKASGFMVEPS